MDDGIKNEVVQISLRGEGRGEHNVNNTKLLGARDGQLGHGGARPPKRQIGGHKRSGAPHFSKDSKKMIKNGVKSHFSREKCQQFSKNGAFGAVTSIFSNKSPKTAKSPFHPNFSKILVSVPPKCRPKCPSLLVALTVKAFMVDPGVAGAKRQ